jgi:CubicO group peptidase (beta-lactamase class C family)
MTAGVTSARNAARGVAIVFALAFGFGLTFATGQERQASPWPVVTPESQGFDSGVLAELLEHVRTKGLPLHNLVLIRRGQLILDAALYPYSPERLHDVASVTKSITSVLVGIAIDKGLIESVRQPVVSLLPAAVRGKPDAQRQAMTVENLLTMTSGHLEGAPHPLRVLGAAVHAATGARARWRRLRLQLVDQHRADAGDLRSRWTRLATRRRGAGQGVGDRVQRRRR